MIMLGAHGHGHEPPGTVLAILTVDDQEKGFRGNRKNFIDLIESGQAAGVQVYVTTVRHLKLGARKIIGYAYDKEKQTWERRFFPAPQVVYNRIPQREDEWLPEVRAKLEECMRHPHIRLFNPGFFNKWVLFKWLSKHKQTKPLVPVTRKFREDLNLVPLLRKYPFLYLKPARGKAGMGIMRVKRRPKLKKNRYVMDVQEKTGNLAFKFPTQTELKLKIRELAAGEDYIVQQGIRLARCNGRPFDLRVLVQKNGKGVWEVTGIGARLAGECSITTHVPRGGSIENPRRLLTAAFNPRAARRILLRVRKTALLLARRIEQSSGHELGELSLDLGVDKAARLWFFEANSKPMKFDEPHIRKKSLKRLIQYSHYLVNRRAKVRIPAGGR